MRLSPRPRSLLIVALIAVLLLIGASAAVAPLRFRAVTLFDKLTGRMAGIEWSDMTWVLGRGNGVDLSRLVATRNPYESIENPLRTKNDVQAGSRLFREQCSSCHGDAGIGGGGGPSLQNHIFKQGRSDWALYRTVRLGIPKTAMVGRSLAREDTWKLVGYLKQVLVGPGAGATATESASLLIEPITSSEILSAKEHPAEWLTYSGSYSSNRHSELTEINRQNVKQLRVDWVRQLETPVDKVETSPVVRGSAMFITEPPNRVLALDAASGRVLWTFSKDLPSSLLLCCGAVNRGVALLGSRVYVGTLDAHLLALDASTGKLIWNVVVDDYKKGYSITGAPLAIENMIVTGVGGGEYGVRGFIDAYDATTGKRLWRSYTLPAPGEPGSETWRGNSSRFGGAPTWLTGSYDPQLRLIYWGVGNPSPNFYGENREGDNLYTNCVVALEPDTGKLRWYFQFTPHDLFDRDAVQIPVLVDVDAGGSKRKLLAWANRNGFYYLLDRATGKFLVGAPFVKQTWASGLDASGRPLVRPESAPSFQGTVVYPGIAGGTNWWSPTYDPELGLMYVPTVEKGAIFFAAPQEPLDEKGETIGGNSMAVPNEDAIVAVKAIDVMTGKIRWQHGGPPRRTNMEMSGLMSTAGKLVFGGDAEDFFAVDAETGADLWRFKTGGVIHGAPVSFALAGHQYVVVAAGRNILAFSLPQQKPVNPAQP